MPHQEADGLAARLAAWWVMCRDGVPDVDAAEQVVRQALLHGSSRSLELLGEDAPRRALSHLLAHRVAVCDGDSGGTCSVSVRELLIAALRPGGSCDSARGPLRALGLDPSPNVREPGVWVARRHRALEQLFRLTEFRDYRWARQLSNLPGAWPMKNANRRIGAYSGTVLFVAASTLETA
jgi:hypothetical protein